MRLPRNDWREVSPRSRSRHSAAGGLFLLSLVQADRWWSRFGGDRPLDFHAAVIHYTCERTTRRFGRKPFAAQFRARQRGVFIIGARLLRISPMKASEWNCAAGDDLAPALAMVLIGLAVYGVAPEADEGTPGHLLSIAHGCPGANRMVLRRHMATEGPVADIAGSCRTI